MANEQMVAEKPAEQSMEAPAPAVKQESAPGAVDPAGKPQETPETAQTEDAAAEEATVQPIEIIPTIVFHLKGIFKGQGEESTQGAFFVTSNNTGGVQLCEVYATIAKEAALPDLQLPAKEFYPKFLEFQKNAALNAEITLPLREAFRGKLNRQKSIEFLRKIATGSNIEIEEELRAWMKEVITTDFVLNVAAEVPLEDEAEEPKDALEDEFEVRLKVQYAIDPAKGKLIKQLNKGEKLIVKVVDERRTGEFLTTLLGAKKEGKEVPVTGEVVKAEEISADRFKVIVRFGPGIYGEGIVGASIKLKTVQSEEEIAPPLPPRFMGVEMTITLPVFIELVALFMILVLVALWGTIK